jgi:hypothetical protein
MKFNILQSTAKDQVPLLSYIVTLYLMTIAVIALIR